MKMQLINKFRSEESKISEAVGLKTEARQFCNLPSLSCNTLTTRSSNYPK
jgi:hypothetical protein